MKFWDSSAVVALLIDEAGHGYAQAQLDQDSTMLVWWGTPVECVSALSRRERDESLKASDVSIALARLHALSSHWHEVLPTTALRTLAERLLRVHPLRAADSFQLAAAITAAEREPVSLDFVSLDDRLKDAAAREGFRVL